MAEPRRLMFLCVGNAVRSQIAEGFARVLGGPAVDARSGGSQPAGFVAPKAIQVMAERGISLAGQESKGIDGAFLERAHVVVATCREAEDACPVAFRRGVRQWGIADPVGLGIDAYRAARDDIEARVRALLAEQGIAAREPLP